MKFKPILREYPNKAITKSLLKSGYVPSTYLEVNENIKDVSELYDKVVEFMDEIENVDHEVPISHCMTTEWGKTPKPKSRFKIVVNARCAIKWLGKIYIEDEILGTI